MALLNRWQAPSELDAQHFSGVPYGGMKDSGLGRDVSFEELVSYTQTQATTIFL